jgi:hypothetical protein
MDFLVKYKVNENGDEKEFVVKSSWFNANLDNDYICDEIYEYIYVDMDKNGLDSSNEENLDNLYFLNREQVVEDIRNYFEERE